jgi:predicted small lipoprotein YifL
MRVIHWIENNGFSIILFTIAMLSAFAACGFN